MAAGCAIIYKRNRTNMNIFKDQAMRHSVITTTLALVVLTLLTAPAGAQKKLRWKAKTGDRFHVVLSTDTKQSMTIGPQTIEIPNSLQIEQVWSVKNVNEQGDFKIDSVVNRVMIEANTPLGKIRYDSAAKEQPGGQLAQMFAGVVKPLVGMKTSVTMSPRGKLSEFKADPAVMKKLQGAGGAGQMFPPDALEKMMVSVSPEFPENLLAGDKWENAAETVGQGGAKMKVSNSYTYAGEEKKANLTLDRIDIKSDIEMPDGMKAMGIELKLVDQSNSGKLFFDNEAGHITSSEAKQKLMMEAEQQGRKMSMTGNTVITATYKKLKPGEEPAGTGKKAAEDAEDKTEDDDVITID